MECEFAELLEKIAVATAKIEGSYFQLPVADADSTYRERVYCYELYHQLRCTWQDFPFSLGGEVDKVGHPHFRGGPYANAKPDLLIHEPGTMDRNLACVEVKPCTEGFAKFRGDLRKLTWFCRHAGYYRGIFLVYGNHGADLDEKLRRASDKDGDIDLGLICIMSHSAIGERATIANL